MTDNSRSQAIGAASMLHAEICRRLAAGVVRMELDGERNVFLTKDEMLAFDAACRLLNSAAVEAYDDLIARRK